MTQDKHTPGRLVAVRNSAYWEVNPVQDRGKGVVPFTVANVCASDPGDQTGLQEANARRLAAAWNACDGIPADALDAGVVNGMMEALREALSLIEIRELWAGVSTETGDTLRAAIARATGAA